MIDSIDRFHPGDLDLAKLTEDLIGDLLGAVDLDDGELMSQWRAEFAPPDMDPERRAEA